MPVGGFGYGASAVPHDRSEGEMNRRRKTALLAGAGYIATAIAFSGPPRRVERAAFRVWNDGGHSAWFRVFQQWGTPWSLPLVAVIHAVRGHRRDALAALGALGAVKSIEVATKYAVRRPRPLYAVPTILRDDAPVEGYSFPSGHIAIASCATVLLAGALGPRARALLVVATAATGYVRVHQGAHLPADAVGGALLGVAVGSGAAELAAAFADS
jgi:membrane-associated phospholipid phosphatase